MIPLVDYRQVGNRKMFVYRCECGNEVFRSTKCYRGNGCSDCYRAGGTRRAKPRALVGSRFVRLVVLERTGLKARVSCDCGAEKSVWVSNLTSGMTKSCGCLTRDSARGRTSHGGTGTVEYRCWTALTARCECPTNKAYRYYGARGIRVAPEWHGAAGFARFLDHVGPRPSPKHSLDRINNNGNYEPGNVRWATSTQQARNTRRNVWLEHDGRRMLAVDWARELGITRQAIEQRIKWGWSSERICSTPASPISGALKGHVPGSKKFTLNGVQDTAAGWSRRLGLCSRTVGQRLRLGFTVEEALTPGKVVTRRRSLGERSPVRRTVPRVYICSACGAPGHNKATCERRGLRSAAE